MDARRGTIESSSDQPLFDLDQGIGLRNGDVEQISDGLRRRQGEPMRMQRQSSVQSAP